MANTVGKIEEYRALRDEMLFTMKERVWGNIIYAGIASGISTQLNTHPNLCIILIIYTAIPFLIHNMIRDSSRKRLASYIRVFLEGDETSLNYERRLSFFRKTYDDDRSHLFSIFKFTIFGLYIILPLFGFIWMVRNCFFSATSTIAGSQYWKISCVTFATIGLAIIFFIICHFLNQEKAGDKVIVSDSNSEKSIKLDHDWSEADSRMNSTKPFDWK